METRVFCVELKMGPSGHMDSTGIFPDSNTREFGPRRTTQRQPPRPTHKCNAPRLPFHVHLTHDLTRAASALPLHTAALAFVSFGIVLVQVQVQVLRASALYEHGIRSFASLIEGGRWTCLLRGFLRRYCSRVAFFVRQAALCGFGNFKSERETTREV